MSQLTSQIEPGDLGLTIDAYLDGELDDEGVAKLAAVLVSSPDARAQFWRIARSVLLLEQWGGEQVGKKAALKEGSLPPSESTGERERPRFLSRFGRSAAVLIVGVVLGTGAAFAIAPPPWRGQRISLQLVNSGFESTDGVTLQQDGRQRHSVPPGYGTWAGDPVRITGSERDVMPVEGTRMLVFERAAPAPGESGDARATACDLYQIVDLSPYRNEIAKGNTMLELSAQFLNAATDRDKPVNFFVRLSVFSTAPDEVLRGWPKTRYDDVASQSNWIHQSDQLSERWRQGTVKLLLPKECQFALIHISVGEGYAAERQAVFGRHYCDDVRLTLTTSAIASE